MATKLMRQQKSGSKEVFMCLDKLPSCAGALMLGALWPNC